MTNSETNQVVLFRCVMFMTHLIGLVWLFLCCSDTEPVECGYLLCACVCYVSIRMKYEDIIGIGYCIPLGAMLTLPALELLYTQGGVAGFVFAWLCIGQLMFLFAASARLFARERYTESICLFLPLLYTFWEVWCGVHSAMRLITIPNIVLLFVLGVAGIACYRCFSNPDRQSKCVDEDSHSDDAPA